MLLDSLESVGAVGELVARDDTEADGRMDMLTVLIHEFGHQLGLDHSDDGVMADVLSVGTRLLPELASSLDILAEVTPVA